MSNPLGFSLAPYLSSGLKRLLKPVSRAYINAAGYRQVGLRYDDLIWEENDVMQKALGRLTPREEYDRAWRIKRASQQSILHKDLPKDQWASEDAKEQRYLTPRINEIVAEEAERAAWDNVKVKHH